MFRPIPAWIVVFMMTGVSLVHAQDDPRADAPIQAGPFYITPTLELMQLGIDTNVFNENGDPQGDYIFRGGPHVDVAMPVDRFLLTVSSAIDYVHYQRLANLRGFNTDLDLRGEVRLRRFTLFLESAFVNTTDRLNLEVDARARRVQNSAQAGLSYELAPRLALEVVAGQSHMGFDKNDPVGRSLGQALNQTTRTASASLAYEVSVLTTLSMIGEREQGQFPDSTGRDIESWSVSSEVEFQPLAVMSGTGRLGYRNLRGTSNALPDFTGPIVDVNLAAVLFGSNAVNVRANRDIEHSFEVLEPYYVAEGAGASLTHRLTDAFDVRVGADFSRLLYRQFLSAEAVGAPTGRADTVRNYTIGITRRVSPAIEMGFDVAYWERRSNQRIDRDYEGVQAGLTAQYAF